MINRFHRTRARHPSTRAPRWLAFAVLALGLSSCAPAMGGRARAVDADERAVLSAVLRDFAGEDTSGTVAMDDSTFALEEEDLELLPDAEMLREEDVRFPMGPIQDIPVRSRRTLSLAGVVEAPPRLRLIVPGLGVKWLDTPYEEMATHIPDLAVWSRISRPGFDAGRRHAAVMIAWSCEGLCGAVQVKLLRRENGNWRVVDTVTTLVS